MKTQSNNEFVNGIPNRFSRKNVKKDQPAIGPKSIRTKIKELAKLTYKGCAQCVF